MMEMLKALFPVLGMMGIGMFCRKSGLVSQKGIDDLKTLMTQIILPIAVFHALATAEYTPQLFTLVGLMLVFMILPFLLGYPLRRVIPQPYSRYTPFMVAVYEGGMMAYPLYASLCGSENLSQIALLDIAGVRIICNYIDDIYRMANMLIRQQDLERLDTLDVELFNEHLVRIMQGETVQTPVFDFTTGRRSDRTHSLHAEADQPLIIEGIHGLNDELTREVERSLKFKIYISALTTLKLPKGGVYLCAPICFGYMALQTLAQIINALGQTCLLLGILLAG